MENQEWHHVVTIEDLEGLNKKIHISYDSIGVQMAFDKAVDVVKENILIKGFRKGKAPKNVIQMLCKKEIEKSALSLLSNEGFLHACFEQKIQPLTKPEVKDEKFNDDGTFSCDIFVEIKPHIVPSGYVGLQLQEPQLSMEESFNKMKELFNQRFSKNVSKEIVEDGNIVTISFVSEDENGEKVSSCSEHNFLINYGQPPPFGENLIGMKVGDVKKESMILPDNFPKRAGEKVSVEITLNSVVEKVPLTDEEIVKKLNISSISEVEEMLKQEAKNEINYKKRQILEENIVDKLVEIHEFNVPIKWVEDEERYLIKQLKIKNIDEQTKEYVNKMAERNVRRTFILDAIFEAENLKVTKEEFEDLIKLEAERRGVSSIIVKKDIKKNNMQEMINATLRNNKVMNLILSQAQIEKENSSENVEVNLEG